MVTNNYLPGGTALLLTEKNLPYATISVNLPESNSRPTDAFYVKHWSENEPIVNQLLKQKLIKKINNISPVSSGFINKIYAYKLTNNFKSEENK